MNKNSILIDSSVVSLPQNDGGNIILKYVILSTSPPRHPCRAYAQHPLATRLRSLSAVALSSLDSGLLGFKIHC